jgi:hypothetical protein
METHIKKGPEAFIPDASSSLLSTEPLVNVSIGCVLCIARNIIDYPTGKHDNDGSHQLSMCNAQDNTISQGELRSSNPHGHYSILPAL